MFFVGCFPLRRHRLSGREGRVLCQVAILWRIRICQVTIFLGEMRASKHAEGNMHKAAASGGTAMPYPGLTTEEVARRGAAITRSPTTT